jgi:DNA mismatch repair ATPase MutS
VLERARQLLSELAVQHVGTAKVFKGRRTQDQDQMELFVDPAKEIARTLAATKLEELSPIQAFDLLRELKKRAT